MCGFMAQLVEHRSAIAKVTGSNPVKTLIFLGFFFPIPSNCDNHSSLSGNTTKSNKYVNTF